MNILLTNDDGIYFDGLWALYRQFRDHHTVTVIAPDRERSAIGHAITLNEPLRATLVTVNGGYTGYAVSGTPADCVKLGLFELLDNRPDMVVAGINPGANVGININYSGTVAAAKEAAVYGVPAVAVSMEGFAAEHCDAAARFVRKLTEKMFQSQLPAGTFLNVNIPSVALAEMAGVRLSRQGLPESLDIFDKRVDPRNRTYYWQGCETQRFDASPDIDGTALAEKFISITPIKCDMTDYGVLDHLKSWEIGI
ncbi:MAG: 5'/3'-nucleotidase SurE [Desulfobacterales bacterium]|jgi:5'-nucleotidase